MKMSFKCRECGGKLKKADGEDAYVCEYCGTKQKISETSNSEKKDNIEIKINNNINFGELQNGYRKSFDVYEAALGTLLFIIFNVAFLFLYRLLPINIRANEAVYYVASFIIEFLFGVVAYTVAKTRKIRIQEAAGLNKKVNAKLVGYSFLVAIICLFCFSNLTSVFIEFLSLCGYQSILSGMQINTFWRYLIYIVTTCITPAVCEELLFRGVVLSGFKKYGKKIAIVVSALIFMLMHGNAEQTVHQFIIGLVIGYIFIETGNLWVGVLIHFFNNFISVTQVYIFSSLLSSMPEVDDAVGGIVDSATLINPWLSLLISLFIALLFAGIGFVLVKWCFKQIKSENDNLNNKKEESINATIIVDGKETGVSVSVDGEELNEGEKIETAGGKSSFGLDEKPQMSVATIIMFALSGAYLLFDWITSLLMGLGIL